MRVHHFGRKSLEHIQYTNPVWRSPSWVHSSKMKALQQVVAEIMAGNISTNQRLVSGRGSMECDGTQMKSGSPIVANIKAKQTIGSGDNGIPSCPVKCHIGQKVLGRFLWNHLLYCFHIVTVKLPRRPSLNIALARDASAHLLDTPNQMWTPYEFTNRWFID